MSKRPQLTATVVGSLLAMGAVWVGGASVSLAEEGDASTTSTTVSPSSTTTPDTTTTTIPAPLRPTKPKKARIGFVRVVLDEQKVYVYGESGRLVTTMPASTGLWDSTPTGSFRVFSKSAATFYTPNPVERMRWMVRFTKGRNGGNIGFHGIPYRVTKAGEVPFPTPLGKAPSSHGCVRMKVADARWLFDNMTLGTRVVVVRTRR